MNRPNQLIEKRASRLFFFLSFHFLALFLSLFLGSELGVRIQVILEIFDIESGAK